MIKSKIREFIISNNPRAVKYRVHYTSTMLPKDCSLRPIHAENLLHATQETQACSMNGDAGHLLRCAVARDTQAQKLVRRGGFDRGAVC
jgi:hypothetical protein